MNIDDVKSHIRSDKFRFSLHAEIEAEADDLQIIQIVTVYIPRPPKFLDAWTRSGDLG